MLSYAAMLKAMPLLLIFQRKCLRLRFRLLRYAMITLLMLPLLFCRRSAMSRRTATAHVVRHHCSATFTLRRCYCC